MGMTSMGNEPGEFESGSEDEDLQDKPLPSTEVAIIISNKKTKQEEVF